VFRVQPATTLGGSRDKDFLVLNAGGVRLMGNLEAKNELWPQIRDWLESRLEGA
jgi:hypothetical protein